MEAAVNLRRTVEKMFCAGVVLAVALGGALMAAPDDQKKTTTTPP